MLKPSSARFYFYLFNTMFMENHRTFTVVLKKGKLRHVVRIIATTKYHAMDLAYYKYPDYEEYQLTNLVRTNKNNVYEKDV